MEALLIILVIPLFGAGIAAADYLSRDGETPRIRRWGRLMLTGGGALLMLAGGLMLAFSLAAVVSPLEGVLWADDSTGVGRFLSFLVRLAIGGVLVFAGWRSLGVARSKPESASIREHILAEQRTAQFHLLKWILMLMPLLMLGFLGVAIALPLLFLSAIWHALIRSREGQFLWELTLAAENGLPLETEVEAFAQTLWRGPRKKFESLAALLRDGHTLADALDLAPRVLSRPVIMELRVAEELGTLPQVLRQCAVRQTRAASTSSSDGSLLPFAAYVWGLLLVIPLLVSFLMVWIVPKFKSIFGDFGLELPAMTVSLIRVSSLFADYFGQLSMLLAVPVFAAMAATVVYVVGWGNLNVPLLMRWFPRRDAPALLRSLALTIRAGRPLPAVLTELAKHHPRRDLSARFRRMSQQLDAGEPTWQVLFREGFIHAEEASALEASARIQNVSWALGMLADGMEGREDRRARLWIELFRPVVVIAIGVLVGLIVVAMFLPLVKLLYDLS